MDTKHEELTAAEHADRAQSQGQSVADYCRQTGVSAHALYSARRKLKRKRVVAGTPRVRRARRKPSKFVALSVAESVPALVCRVRHPNGWVIECARWPDPSWMRDLAGERT